MRHRVARTISSAYRIDGSIHRPDLYLWMDSIPLRAMFASNGLTTPPRECSLFGKSWVNPCFKTAKNSCLDTQGGDELFHDGCVAYPVETFFNIKLYDSLIYSINIGV